MIPSHVFPNKYAASDKTETISGSQGSKFQMFTDSANPWDVAMPSHRTLERVLRVF